jgi:hypothetical protein
MKPGQHFKVVRVDEYSQNDVMKADTLEELMEKLEAKTGGR